MRSLVFAYYDKQIGAYSTPNFVTGLDENALIISLKRAVKGGTFKMPNMDVLDVYYFGTFEDESGEFTLLPKPKFLVALSEFMDLKTPSEIRKELNDEQKNN